MPGIGADIEEVINELGVSVTILRSPSNIIEKITYEINEQATNSFVREYHLNAAFKYNTNIMPGDLLVIGTDNFIAANKTPDVFEGEVVEYAAVIMKCNALVDLQVYSSVTDPTTYRVTNGWTTPLTAKPALINQSARGVQNNPNVSEGKEITYRLDCYVPASYGVLIGTRVKVSTTEYYRVQDIEKYMIPGIWLLSLVEDDRGAYTELVVPP